jgi:Ankyrin repeats (3 copies)
MRYQRSDSFSSSSEIFFLLAQANIFVHFKPVNHDENNEKDLVDRLGQKAKGFADTLFHGVKKVIGGNIGGHEQHNHDLDEIRRHQREIEGEGGFEDPQMDPFEEDDEAEEAAFERKLTEQDLKDGRTELHIAAAMGDIHTVRRILKVVVEGSGADSDILHARDANNWQAIHEAARGGHLEVLEYLVNMGADLAAKTNKGGTPLWWAKKTLQWGHPVIEYLQNIGAPDESDAPGEE